MPIKPSKYQSPIFSAVIAGTQDVAIEATAGSGKTTTLVEIAKLLPYSKRAVFVAFNKHIVVELKSRLPRTMDCSTLHSVGFAATRKYIPGETKLNDKKQLNFIMPLFEKEKNQRKKWVSIFEVDHLMKLARATMTEGNEDAFNKLIEIYGVDFTPENVPKAVRALKQFYAFNSDSESRYNLQIDFQDMVEFVVMNKEVRMPLYDYVLIDEAQDLSRLDQLFINKLVKPISGRKIIVGDPNQAIYSFRGASLTSFEEMTTGPNVIKLPLSICYRCAKSIVREAKKIYPVIEENPDQEEGIVRRGGESFLKDIREEDLVICRNTRPLINVFFKLIEQGKKAYILGKDIEKGLKALLVNIDDSMSLEDIHGHFVTKKETLKKVLIDKGVTNPNNNNKLIELSEKIETLIILFTKLQTVSAVEEWIEETFEDDEREGILLCTIHRAKGMERTRVFWITHFEEKQLIPSQYAVTKDQLIQERNLSFVATTRAKKELVYLLL